MIIIMIIVIIITIYCNTRTLSHILTLALAHLHICYDADYTIRISHSEFSCVKNAIVTSFFFSHRENKSQNSDVKGRTGEHGREK